MAAAPSTKSQSDSAQEATQICWICLGAVPSSTRKRLCNCPTRVHEACLSRWRLQCAGRSEETHCRFCKAQLPNWQDYYSMLSKAAAVMTISTDKAQDTVWVTGGQSAMKAFQDRLCHAHNNQPGCIMDVTFHCQVPDSGEALILQGWHTWEAAVFCASVAAGRQELHVSQLHGAGSPLDALGCPNVYSPLLTLECSPEGGSV